MKNIEEDEEENDIEVEVKSNTPAVEQDEEEKQPEVRKETVIKPVVAKKYQSSILDKSISILQNQLNKHFKSEQEDRQSCKTNRKKNVAAIYYIF